eukprot:393685_1
MAQQLVKARPNQLVQFGIVYALKSVSSGNYLDGRGGDAEPLMTNRNPKGDQFLLWVVIQTNNGFALKSCSSNKYLDGRSKEKEPLMTYRDPMNDKFLQW